LNILFEYIHLKKDKWQLFLWPLKKTMFFCVYNCGHQVFFDVSNNLFLKNIIFVTLLSFKKINIVCYNIIKKNY